MCPSNTILEHHEYFGDSAKSESRLGGLSLGGCAGAADAGQFEVACYGRHSLGSLSWWCI